MKKQKRFWPSEENPRYGEAFQIVAVQMVTIEREFTEWIPIQWKRGRIEPVGKDWFEWRKNKTAISEELTKFFNSSGRTGDPYREMVAMKIHYFGDGPRTYRVV